MATIDGKPSRRRPGFTPQDVRRAPKVPNPRTARGKAIAASGGVDKRVVGIAELLANDPTADEAKERNG